MLMDIIKLTCPTDFILRYMFIFLNFDELIHFLCGASRCFTYSQEVDYLTLRQSAPQEAAMVTASTTSLDYLPKAFLAAEVLHLFCYLNNSKTFCSSCFTLCSFIV